LYWKSYFIDINCLASLFLSNNNNNNEKAKSYSPLNKANSSLTMEQPNSDKRGEIDRSLNKFNVINLISYLCNVFVTFAIGTFGLAGRPTNGELSDKYQTIVTPVGLSFSIWGLIFIVQALWCLWQFLPSQRNSEGVQKVGYLYAIVCLFQCGWTLAFSWEIMWLSLVCMYGILVGLVWAVLNLQKYEKIWKGYFLWQFPLSVHCGWIIAASAVNTNVLPVFYQASATTQVAVAGASLGVLVMVGMSWLQPYPVDFTPPLVLVWALAGVYLSLDEPKDSLTATFTEQQLEGIKYATVGGLVLIALGVFVKALYVCVVQRPRAMKRKESGSANKQQLDVEEGSA
jgi:hypothetical protein